eukprot:5638008-Prymnesium_polylepis.1
MICNDDASASVRCRRGSRSVTQRGPPPNLAKCPGNSGCVPPRRVLELRPFAEADASLRSVRAHLICCPSKPCTDSRSQPMYAERAQVARRVSGPSLLDFFSPLFSPEVPHLQHRRNRTQRTACTLPQHAAPVRDGRAAAHGHRGVDRRCDHGRLRSAHQGGGAVQPHAADGLSGVLRRATVDAPAGGADAEAEGDCRGG